MHAKESPLNAFSAFRQGPPSSHYLEVFCFCDFFCRRCASFLFAYLVFWFHGLIFFYLLRSPSPRLFCVFLFLRLSSTSGFGFTTTVFNFSGHFWLARLRLACSAEFRTSCCPRGLLLFSFPHGSSLWFFFAPSKSQRLFKCFRAF